MKFLRAFIRLLATIMKRFIADGCTGRAASLAFATLLSIVPLMTVSFTVLSALPEFQQFATKVQNFIFQNFVAESAQIVQQNLAVFVQQTSKLSTWGTLFLTITAVLMVFNMEQAFNAIWRTGRHRSFISAFIMYWAVLTLTPILIGIGLALTTYVASVPLISVAAEILGLKKFLLTFTPFISSLVAFTILYLAVPNTKVKFRYAFTGGIIATLLFELAKQGFVFYITRFSIYRLLYGALAAVPIFLVWIYLSWLIILFGAVVSAVLEDRSKKKPIHHLSHQTKV